MPSGRAGKTSSKKGKRLTLEEELEALTEVAAHSGSAAARARLAVALKSRRSLVVARAARLIKEHRVDGFEKELQAAFERFLDDPVKSDPSCNAKLAVIEALDYGESVDCEPFLRAARHIQMEPAWGRPIDTAAPLRGRGVMALARIAYADFELLAAELLNDAEPPVRQAAADALQHRGDRSGAALALYKLRAGDEDPMVTLAAMNALFALAPDWGLATLAPLLDGNDEQARELAAVALGQSKSEQALTLLLEALERCVRAEEREAILRGVGLHRSERALVAMLDLIAEGTAADAKAAIVALDVRRFEPGVADRVRRAARQNQRADLGPVVDETFPEELTQTTK
jgi:hypothetical protein